MTPTPQGLLASRGTLTACARSVPSLFRKGRLAPHALQTPRRQATAITSRVIARRTTRTLALIEAT